MNLVSTREKSVREMLAMVKDPEIDSVSVLDLGMVENIAIEGSSVHVEMLPTFMGCPALEIIKANVENKLLELDWVEKANVSFIYHPAWTSERVTSEGRERLKEFGIAPPPEKLGPDGQWHVDCPYCNSTYTTMDNIFGPTACRSILYCKQCKNPFEAMKPVSTMM